MVESAHISVLKNEAIEYLSPQDGQIYVDGTFGAGGHSKAILETADCKVYGIDRDINVKQYAIDLQQQYSDRFTFIEGKFSNMQQLLTSENITKVDGILLDIGVSSMQIDEAARGFSFSKDGPLDMRMGQHGTNAKDFINQASEQEIADVIYQYGDERKSRRIAKAITSARAEKEITTTKELADIIRDSVGRYNDKIHPATRTFQALRIWVNEEFSELKKVLNASIELLNKNGRLVVITFHSGEDVIVKKFINDNIGKVEGVSRHAIAPLHDEKDKKEILFKKITRKAIKPSTDELEYNIRARSAKLRAAMRV